MYSSNRAGLFKSIINILANCQISSIWQCCATSQTNFCFFHEIEFQQNSSKETILFLNFEKKSIFFFFFQKQILFSKQILPNFISNCHIEKHSNDVYDRCLQDVERTIFILTTCQNVCFNQNCRASFKMIVTIIATV